MINKMFYRSVCLGLWLLVLPGQVAAGSMVAFEALNQTEQESLRVAKQFVYDQKWTQAVTALEGFLAAAKDQNLIGECRYWLAYSLNKAADDQDEGEREIELKQKAFSVLTELGQRHPGSRWLKDGRILSVEIADDLVDSGLTSYKKYITSASNEDQDIELKLVALDALLQMDEAKAFPILERIIRSNPDQRMRNKALFVVSQSDHPDRVTLLLEAARSDEDPGVREKAVFWLGQSDSPQALKALKDLYSSSSSADIREKIVFAISQQGGGEAVRTLIDLYRGETRTGVKKKIIFWLGQMDEAQARKFIESLLQ